MGTRPNYNNTLPFELIIKNNNTISSKAFIYKWDVIRNLKPIQSRKETQTQQYIQPKDKFNNEDLTSDVFSQIKNSSNIITDYIHIPIYICLNNYGHYALNDWDENSIDLGNDSGVILAPQIRAGKKKNNNIFIGYFYGYF